jgi:hypothetical protein
MTKQPFLLPVPDNDDRVDIEINVTNCADDDAPDFTRNDDVAVHSSFNYRPTDACDRNLIDLMNEGDNYVSSNCCVPNLSGDLQLVRPTITTTVFAESFDAVFARALDELMNGSEQFNYKRDKIVEITEENKYLFGEQTRADETFSSDERRNIFGNSSENDGKNEIRFKEHDGDDCVAKRQAGGLSQSHLTYAGCDELDNCFLESKIANDDDVERG